MKTLLTKIKSKGYWRVVIRPSLYRENLFDRERAEELIYASKVQLRGWDYPHIDREGIRMADERSIESACDWTEGPMFEYWRFYCTGQFVHYFSMREDLRIDEENVGLFQREYNTSATRFLDVLSTIYSITEIYLFALRLASNIQDVQEWNITAELHGVNGRTLMFWDRRRSLFQAYTCSFEKDVIALSRTIPRDDLITKFDSIALDVLLDLFASFNWKNPSRDILFEDQKKFLERRI